MVLSQGESIPKRLFEASSRGLEKRAGADSEFASDEKNSGKKRDKKISSRYFGKNRIGGIRRVAEGHSALLAGRVASILRKT